MGSFCSPNNQEIYDKTKTCYTLENLKLIAKNYNSTIMNKNNRIKLSVSKKRLLEQLHEKLRVPEHVWYKMNFMKTTTPSNKMDELFESFKPEKPASWKANPNTWLDTYNILNVMNQYEDKYHSFKFLGVHPLDFSHKLSDNMCVSNTMCDFNLKRLLSEGKTQCGVVLNLSYHNQLGSHWVCLYTGLSPALPNFGCYYIDSGASPAPDEVKRFAQVVKSQIKTHYGTEEGKHFKVKENRRQFQFENTECGMFAMYFLVQFLQRKSFKSIINSNINDQSVYALRDEYYL